MTESPSTFAEQAVDKVSRWLDKLPRTGRRSFLVKTAVVGSALAVNPIRYAMRPVSAYDAVCGTGNTCADGWSVFCCTINNGQNSCPPGTFSAGWWKADNSAFCCGSARYYLDCNVMCGVDRPCRCVTGTCDSRFDSCNQFRYGQCNQQIACYGPVACRLVSCTPPWQLTDLNCTTSSATDNNTVTHSAPCLPGQCASDIMRLWVDLGSDGSPLGPLKVAEGPTPDGYGRVAYFRSGAIYAAWGAGVHEVHGLIWERYAATGSVMGPLGYPTTNETPCPDGIGRYNHFHRGGSIYWTPTTGAHAVVGAIRYRWALKGWERSALGYPTTDELPVGDGTGRYNAFQGGRIYWSPTTDAHEVRGLINQRYQALGGALGDLGYPITDETGCPDGVGRFNHFSKGASIYWTPTTGAHAVVGAIRYRWALKGWERSALGYPTTDELPVGDGTGRYNVFQGGRIYWSPTTDAHEVRGLINLRYQQLGGATGTLGYPITDETGCPDGVGRFNDFASGASIYWTPATGAHEVPAPIRAYWRTAGAEQSTFGYPAAAPETSGDITTLRFQHGSLRYDASTDTVTELP